MVNSEFDIFEISETKRKLYSDIDISDIYLEGNSFVRTERLNCGRGIDIC